MAKISMKAAWMRGRQAAVEGEAMAANPFVSDVAVSASWADGWRMGVALALEQKKRTDAEEPNGGTHPANGQARQVLWRGHRVRGAGAQVFPS